MRRIAILAFFVLSTAAIGQTRTDLYKCVRGKEIVYQSEPCPAAYRTDKIFSRPPLYESRAAAAERQRIQDEMDQRNAAQRSSGWPQTIGHRYDETDCRNAKARRNRLRQQIGAQRITRKQERELCQPVARACGYCPD